MATVTRQAGLRMVAEFILIVIGVLVAFAVNDWASRRAERVVETQYLEALLGDLQADSITLADVHVPNLAFRQMRLESIAPVARREVPLPRDTVAFLLEVAESHRTPLLVGRGATYDELVSTGSLRIVESADLRTAVVRYYQLWELTTVRSDSRASGYPELIRSFLPEGTGASRVSGAESGPAARTPEAVRAMGVDRAIEAIYTPEFNRALNRHINYLGLMRPTLDSLLVEVQGVIPLVRQELDRLK